MTTTRIVRGTKARVFLYICAVLIITGVIACYNNTLSQLEDARKSSEICHQQEENLSTQLQVISDYKQRLEKSLKTEKAEHQQMKTDLENKLNEERAKREKQTNESNLRFNSLQQQLNLLQTRHDDLKEECSNNQNKQLNEINDLQAKLKEVQEELKKVESSKENLKTQYLQAKVDKESIERKLKEKNGGDKNNENEINHLTKVNHELERELDAIKEKCPSYDTLQAPVQEVSSPKTVQNFDKQVQINAGEYQIRNQEQQQPPQQEKNVLALPSSQNQSPSKSSTTASSLKVSQGSLNGARPLLMPTVTPKSSKVEVREAPVAVNVLPIPYAVKVPEGVVQPPPQKPQEEKNELPNDRYRNKIESEAKDELKVQESKKNEEAVDKENGANEVFDQPLQGGAYDGLAFGDENNNAVKNADKQVFHKQHIDALAIGDNKDKDGLGVGNKNYDGVDYKDNMPLEENDPEEDDDGDDYADHLARQKDPAVRN